MTEWEIRTSKSKRKMGTFYGTKKDAIKWAKDWWKIDFQVVSVKTKKVTQIKRKRS